MSIIYLAFVGILSYISGMNTTHIYTLAHPVTGVIRYVGKANNLRARMALHLRKHEQTKKSKWIQRLQSQGLAPVVEILDVVPVDEWQFWEVYWIAQLKAWGHSLYNGDNGGLGSDRLLTETKGKISDALRERPQPKKWVSYAQYDLTGRWIATHVSARTAGAAVSSEHSVIVTAARRQQRAKGFLWLRVAGQVPAVIASHYTGNCRPPVSEATRQKISVATAGRAPKPATDETRAKMRAARLGKAPANKGVPATAAQRAVNQAANTAKKQVCQSTLDGQSLAVWPSVKAAAAGTGATRAGILNTIKGKNKHASGFKWSYPIPSTIENPS